MCNTPVHVPLLQCDLGIALDCIAISSATASVAKLQCINIIYIYLLEGVFGAHMVHDTKWMKRIPMNQLVQGIPDLVVPNG